MKCIHCNQEHTEGTQFCPKTGNKIIKTQYCPQCSNPVEPGWIHCGYCGRKLILANETSEPKRAQAASYPQAPPIISGISKNNRKSSIIPWLGIVGGLGVLLIVAAVLPNSFLNITNPGLATPMTANAAPTAKIASGSANSKEVDAMTFLTAFQEGKVDQYLGFTVKGEGREFSNYIFGAAPQGPLNLTLGAIGPDHKVTILRSWKEWSDAEADGQPMLMLQLSGSNFARMEFNPSETPVYSFSGRYMGETTPQIRLVYKTGQEPGSFLIPVLVDGVVK
jgi:hypothetical protein